MSYTPNPIEFDKVTSICGLGKGEETCAFLVCGAGGFECAKGSVHETIIRNRLLMDFMKAKGDNCQGPQKGFTPL